MTAVAPTVGTVEQLEELFKEIIPCVRCGEEAHHRVAPRCCGNGVAYGCTPHYLAWRVVVDRNWLGIIARCEMCQHRGVFMGVDAWFETRDL